MAAHVVAGVVLFALVILIPVIVGIRDEIVFGFGRVPPNYRFGLHACLVPLMGVAGFLILMK